MSVTYKDIETEFSGTGLVVRGGFETAADEDPSGKTIVLIGNVGPEMWVHFSAARQDVKNPLDTWTKSVVAPRARALGAQSIHPNDKPYRPFQQWALRAEPVFSSPLGILIHPDHGLWHAYRAALIFDVPVSNLPVRGQEPSPCTTCADRPCLSACPVDAFTSEGYDVPTCIAHLDTPASGICHDGGCLARLACPVAPNSRTTDAQRAFHTAAFYGAWNGSTLD